MKDWFDDLSQSKVIKKIKQKERHLFTRSYFADGVGVLMLNTREFFGRSKSHAGGPLEFSYLVLSYVSPPVNIQPVAFLFHIGTTLLMSVLSI